MTDSLFEINRYDPEQDESKQENVLLENINKRIKEKRKLDNNPNKEISNDNEPVKKKRKKNKKKNKKLSRLMASPFWENRLIKK